jgi:hypothetical protein
MALCVSRIGKARLLGAIHSIPSNTVDLKDCLETSAVGIP